MHRTIARRLLLLAIAAVALALPASASAVPPAATLVSPVNLNLYGTQLPITVTSSNVDITLLWYIDAAMPAGTFSDPSSPRSLTTYADISGLSDGVHQFQISALSDDGSGDMSTFFRYFTVDNTPPSLTLNSPVADGGATALTELTWTFQSSQNEIYRCSFDNSATQACSTPYTRSGLANGEHTISVYSLDSAGNQSPTSTVTFTVNTAWATPPETVFTAKPDATISTTTANFSFESGTATSFECSLDNGSYSACTSPHAVTALSLGAHTLSVRSTDPTGQVELAPETATFSVVAASLPPGGSETNPLPVPAPTVSKASGKAKNLAFTVSGAGSISAKVEACKKKSAKTVCKSFTTGTATATTSGKLTITLTKSLKPKSKYRVTFTSTSSTGATAKSVVSFKTK